MTFYGHRVVVLLVQGFHCGEQDDFADGIVIGQQHDRTVDADAHTARGGHTVFHSIQEVLVQHLCLVVTALTLLHLLHKATSLVDGVVQLGVGVSQLGVADKQLEPFRESGTFCTQN